jgi:hypothetical protein
MEMQMRQTPTALTDIATICNDPSIDRHTKGSCVHGLGHAIVDINGIDVVKNLALCDRFGLEDRVQCATGVFMELYEQSWSPGWTASIADDPRGCSAFADPYKEVCFARAGIRTYVHTQDLSRAIQLCSRAPVGFQKDCIIDAGKYVYFAFPKSAEDEAQGRAFCTQYMADDVEHCIERIFYNSIE